MKLKFFRPCDPKTLNLPDGVTWKSKTTKNAIIFKFFCPGNNGYSTVRIDKDFL